MLSSPLKNDKVAIFQSTRRTVHTHGIRVANREEPQVGARLFRCAGRVSGGLLMVWLHVFVSCKVHSVNTPPMEKKQFAIRPGLRRQKGEVKLNQTHNFTRIGRETKRSG